MVVCQLDTSRITLEGSLNEELSTLGWPVDMPIGNFLNWVNHEGKTHHEYGWHHFMC